MLEMGILVALGILVTLAKVPWRQKLWMTGHPLLMDAIVFAFLIAIHWGTFSGVMVASIGALFCSLTLSAAKYLVGHITAGRYYPGRFNVLHKIKGN
jgi:ascorbate-specific PTS system EIIC-type component UlaA